MQAINKWIERERERPPNIQCQHRFSLKKFKCIRQSNMYVNVCDSRSPQNAEFHLKMSNFCNDISANNKIFYLFHLNVKSKFSSIFFFRMPKNSKYMYQFEFKSRLYNSGLNYVSYGKWKSTNLNRSKKKKLEMK